MSPGDAFREALDKVPAGVLSAKVLIEDTLSMRAPEEPMALGREKLAVSVAKRMLDIPGLTVVTAERRGFALGNELELELRAVVMAPKDFDTAAKLLFEAGLACGRGDKEQSMAALAELEASIARMSELIGRMR